MRISTTEKECFIQVIQHFLPAGQEAEIRLYGSRLDDQKKGGDFDILVVLPEPEKAKALSLKLHYILAEIKQKIGDQRIDLKIIAKDTLKTDLFLEEIYNQSKKLH